MAIKLEDYESGDKFDGDYSDALKEVQERLSQIQSKHVWRRPIEELERLEKSNWKKSRMGGKRGAN